MTQLFSWNGISWNGGMDNKRRFLRRRLGHGGFVMFGTHMRSCLVSDASEGGARIQIHDPADVPDQFVLSLSKRGPPCRKCQVVWRTETALGVRWESQSQNNACDPDVCGADCPRLSASEPAPAAETDVWVV
jgi:hypothetical protein